MATARFSVIMPTFNRADTIKRAIDSVLGQTFGDFELLITDDGSTDGTAELVRNIDPRIKVFVQENQGIGGARNTAMRNSTGQHIAFLDSDDEWLPHHLAMGHAFFETHPAEHLFSGEFWSDFGGGYVEKHFLLSMGEWFPRMADTIGCGSLRLPPGEIDGYLRFYSSRSPLLAWGRDVLQGTPYLDGAFHYRGHIFEGWRWGWIMAAQNTIVSRTVLDSIGLLEDQKYPIASDFPWLARACQRYEAHMVSAPSCIKHEHGIGGARMGEEHLATGRTKRQFAKDLLRAHEELFWNAHREDPELTALRGYCQLFLARTALAQGDRPEALAALREAAKSYPGWEARALLQILRAVPGTLVPSRLFAALEIAARLSSRTRNRLVRRGQAHA